MKKSSELTNTVIVLTTLGTGFVIASQLLPGMMKNIFNELKEIFDASITYTELNTIVINMFW